MKGNSDIAALALGVFVVISTLWKEAVSSPFAAHRSGWSDDHYYEDYSSQNCVLDNGEIYQSGSDVPSDQPCKTCTCEAGPLGPLIVCDSSSCDASNDEELYKYQNCTMENGSVYRAGSIVPSTNPCQSCTCESGPMGALVVCVTSNPGCTVEPTQNYSQQSCIVDGGEVYQAGSIVPSPDPCQTCRCETSPTGAIVVCMSRDCGVPSCVDSVRVAGSCCPICPNGPSCLFGRGYDLLRPADGNRKMVSFSDSCGIWCRCDLDGDLDCSLECNDI